MLGKPGASDLSLCHAKSSGRIAEFSGIFLLLLELSAVIRILRQDAVAEDGETTAPARPLHGLFEAGIWWALSTLCVVENLYLGLVPLIVLWLIHLWQLRRRKTEKRE